VQQNKVGEQKSCRLFGLFNLTLLLLSTTLFAQSFADFKRSQESSFAKYRDERDAAFNSYLKSQWDEYTAQAGKPFYEKEKPKNITPAVQKEIASVGPKISIEIDTKKEINANIRIIISKPKVVKYDVNFDFFGETLGFNIENSIKSARYYPQTQVGIVNYFNVIASNNYDDIVREISQTSKELQLNDWGVYLLVLNLAQSIYENQDESKLFTWFILNKLGYDVKVGLSSKHVVLMHYSEKLIYATPSYSFGKKRFYVISNYAKGSAGRVYTYKQSYPEATKPLDLELKQLPKFAQNIQKKTLKFKQYTNEYTISYNYNKNIIDFMATYPQADYETYFNAPMQESTYQEIAGELKKYINEKQASVALNFVLNFVQKAFKYERDDEQFGREKVMFAEETLYYDKSDCEDRAILFSYLVKELFNIGVIGVKYKDHMATALYIPMKGDSVKSGQRKFVIADPTYINANIGQSMPKYKSTIPESFIIVQK
jgi:hypothetical protein